MKGQGRLNSPIAHEVPVHLVAAAGPSVSVRLSFGVRGGFAAAQKNPRMGPTLVELGGSGKDQAMSAARPLCPSAMRPTAQHASSPAIATLATLDCLPEASIARRLSTSRRTPALAWRRASGGTDWPLAGLFGARDALL